MTRRSTSVWTGGGRAAEVDTQAERRRAAALAGPVRVTRATACRICLGWIWPGKAHQCAMPCECGAPLVAGIDHTCDPDERPDGGLAWR